MLKVKRRGNAELDGTRASAPAGSWPWILRSMQYPGTAPAPRPDPPPTSKGERSDPGETAPERSDGPGHGHQVGAFVFGKGARGKTDHLTGLGRIFSYSVLFMHSVCVDNLLFFPVFNHQKTGPMNDNSKSRE